MIAIAWGVAVALVVALAACLLLAVVDRAARGARAAKSGTVIPRWERPDGVDLLECASVASRGRAGVAAALVDLAVRGHLRILAGNRATTGPGSAPTTLELLRTDGLTPLEGRLIRTIFPRAVAGERHPIESASGFRPRVTPLTRIIEAARRSTVERGLRFERPTRRYARIANWLLVISVVDAVVLVAADRPLTVALLPVGALFVRAMVRRLGRPAGDGLTANGRALLDHLEGMRLYLTVAEEDRIRVLQSPGGAQRVAIDDDAAMLRLVERLLPFAVLWGVEREWVRAIQVRFPDERFDWYDGGTSAYGGVVGAESALYSDLTMTDVVADLDAGAGAGDGSMPGDPADSSSYGGTDSGYGDGGSGGDAGGGDTGADSGGGGDSGGGDSGGGDSGGGGGDGGGGGGGD